MIELNSCHCMDNLDILDLIDDNSIDLSYNDILYGTGQEFEDYSDNLWKNPKEAVDWYRPRFEKIHKKLKNTGSLYIQCDWHLNSYIRVLLDEIFGFQNYRNEIIRIQSNPKNNSNNYGKIFDNILFYTKSNKFTWNEPKEPKNERDLLKQFNKIDDNGRRYTTTPLHAKGETKNGETGKAWNSSHGLIYPPKGRHWRVSHQELNKLDKLGLIEWSSNNNPRKIIYSEDYLDKAVQNIWDFKSMGYNNQQVVYDTEKPEELLDRIIRTSSNENDVFADFFVGGGSSILKAYELNRKYIGCDINPNAILTCEKKIEEYKKSSLL